MSRSRKKYPLVSDYSRNFTNSAKRKASKSVRNFDGYIPNGKSFKKIYCSYNIFDYKSYWDNEKAYRK